MTTTTDANTSAQETVIDPNANASALAHRRAALTLLRGTNLSNGRGDGATGQRQRLVDELNGTFEHVLDDNRVTNRDVFRADKRVGAPLSQRAPNVTAHLVAADARQARQAVADANRAHDVLRARNVTYDETAVSEEIRDAERALERADDRRQKNGVSAIGQYRTAWTHAQRALDQMDWAVDPNVTIETRDDMPHEGNVTHAVNGTVFDVRTYEIETVTISHDGQNRTVQLETSTAPVTNGTFNATVTLDEPVNEIPVRGTDPNDALAPHDDDTPPPVTGIDVLRMDSDGLPDRYEERVVGTEPLNSNSNSSGTDRNESTGDTIDGAEDFDGDGTGTYPEYLFGTNPLSSDTDGDDLDDGFEIRTPGVGPLTIDTDDNGTADSDEDFDVDGLSNRREQAAGTGPFAPDTDTDGLDDGVELAEHGTAPRKPDTDVDGLLDGEELELGVDPLSADTDGDGTLDGNETFTTTAENESVGVAVDLTGQGNAAERVQVRNGTRSIFEGGSVTNAAVSEMVDLRIDREFEDATVSLQYDDSTVDDESSLAVYRYDSEAQTFAPVESTVDEENNTVSARTSEFETFVVLNTESWEAGYESEQVNESTAGHDKVREDFEDPVGWDCENDCDMGGGSIVVGGGSATSLDINPDEGSIPTPPEDDSKSPPTGKSPTGEKTVEAECIANPDPNKRCYYPPPPTITTTTTTSTERPTTLSETPTPPPETAAPPSWSDYTTTFADDAESITITTYLRADANGSKSGAKLLIIGESGTTVPFSVSAGESRGWTKVERDLTHLAGETVTLRLKAGDESTIESSFLAIEITRDSDNDGLLNQVEREGMRTGWSSKRIETDPYSADTDGDGLSDDEEVGRYTNRYGRTYFSLDSKPHKADSDDDGIGDYEETTETREIIYTESRKATVNFYQALNDDETNPMQHFEKWDVSSDPMESDSDGDFVDDRRELMLGTHPNKDDTDGDGIRDVDELKYGTDPTLFDAKPPTISVKAANSYSIDNSLDRLYYAQFGVKDASRVSYVGVIKGDEARFEDRPHVRWARYSTQFKTGPVENTLDGLLGTTVDIKAVDRHENGKRITAYSRTNVAGHVAKELQTGTIFDYVVAQQAGAASGFLVGAGQTLKQLKEYVEDPLSFFKAIVDIVKILDHLGILDDLIKSIPGQLEQKQDLNNPYSEQSNPDLYNTYKVNWYGGYIAFFILEMVVGAQAAKIVKKSDRLASLVDKLDSTGHLRKAARFYGRAKGKATAPARVVGYKVARGTAKTVDISASGTRKVLSSANTAGQQVRVSYHLRRMDSECLTFTTFSGGCGNKIDDLDADQKRKYGRLATSHKDWPSLAEKLPARTIKRILDSDNGKAAVDLYNSGVSPSQIRRLTEADVDLKRVTKLLKNRYDGKWTSGRYNNGEQNFDSHYEKHVLDQNEWGTDSSGKPQLSEREYRLKARKLANKRTNVEVYYQKGRRNMLIYDRKTDELVVANVEGKIQTLFKPKDDYIGNKISNSEIIRIK